MVLTTYIYLNVSKYCIYILIYNSYKYYYILICM